MNGNLGIPEVSPEPLGILMVDLRELTVWMDKLMVDIGRPQFVAGRDPMSDKPGSDQDMICQTATRYDLSNGGVSCEYTALRCYDLDAKHM